MNNRCIIFCFLIVSLFLSPAWADNFIFDLDGVLFRTDSVAALKHIGLGNIIHTMLSLRKNSHAIQQYMETKFLEVLDKAAQEHGFDNSEKEHHAYYRDGQILPYFMGAWLRGAISGKDVSEKVINSINANPEWFRVKREAQLISNLVTLVFTPENLVKSRKINKRAADFVLARKKEGHKLYVLSNWDPDSFELLRRRYYRLFDLFDGLLISGTINSVKPSPLIYKTLLESHELIAGQSWFIDDQQENIVAACDLNIKGILCERRKGSKKPDFYLIGQKIPNCKTPKERRILRKI
jgi:FMN phosphatase YigB (HAD superfamily)